MITPAHRSCFESESVSVGKIAKSSRCLIRRTSAPQSFRNLDFVDVNAMRHCFVRVWRQHETSSRSRLDDKRISVTAPLDFADFSED